MFKKLRERIYNRKAEQELKEIEYFDTVCNELFSIYLTFVKFPKNSEEKLFQPQTVYAIKRAIQKLSTDYIATTSTTHFEKVLDRAFQNAGFDKNKIGECMALFNSKKNILFNSKKNILKKTAKYGLHDGRLNKVEEFLKLYGFDWDGRYSSVHCTNPKMAESLDDLNPEYECAYLYEKNGKGGFFLISESMFSRFKHTHGDKFEEIANYENEWKEFLKLNEMENNK